MLSTLRKSQGKPEGGATNVQAVRMVNSMRRHDPPFQTYISVHGTSRSDVESSRDVLKVWNSCRFVQDGVVFGRGSCHIMLICSSKISSPFSYPVRLLLKSLEPQPFLFRQSLFFVYNLDDFIQVQRPSWGWWGLAGYFITIDFGSTSALRYEIMLARRRHPMPERAPLAQ